MTENQPSFLARIPTVAFFVVPLVYGAAFCLYVLFPIFGERYLLRPVIWVSPWILALSFCIVVVQLALPPRTWPMWWISVFLNLAVAGFAACMSCLAFPFQAPD